jgi:hypothetical protein
LTILFERLQFFSIILISDDDDDGNEWVLENSQLFYNILRWVSRKKYLLNKIPSRSEEDRQGHIEIAKKKSHIL